ncbi:MAG: Fur family transcriptional regulator [Opitutaceae bacterium]
MIASTQSNHPLSGVKNFDRIPAPLDLACARLKSAGLRITQPRIAILETLINRDSPASIEQIHNELTSDACDLVTVYRCLAVFEELGLVRRCFFHNGTSLYEINLNDSRHYHVVCRSCGKVERIDAALTEGVERMLRERGYDQVSHMVEFFGVCPACQKPAVVDPASVTIVR